MSTAIDLDHASRIGAHGVRTRPANRGSICTTGGVQPWVADCGSTVFDRSGEGVRRISEPRGSRSGHTGVRRVALLLLAAVFAFAAAGTAPRADQERRILLTVALPQTTARPTWAEERAVFAAHLERAFRLKPSIADEFGGWILEASTRQTLPPELLASLIMTESSFRKEVGSAMGAVGPGQVRPDLWGAWCGVNLADPEENVDCAARILAHYVELCAQNSTDAAACALRSYNVGYRNRNNRYYFAAADRYLAKIERYLDDLRSISTSRKPVHGGVGARSRDPGAFSAAGRIPPASG
ncbi:MAG: lytic transglycosylase domain-containing protein [Gammaproteobacteria bacterium]|nr:lytic transglycosylase domain-containing protein [Gammaproteobacteria bacterium]